MKSKRYAKVDKRRCVACGACMKECPKGAISIVQGCYAKVDKDICVGCGRCAKTCPADVIALLEREDRNE